MTALPDPSAPLDSGAAEYAFAAILDGKIGDEALEAFLVTLAERGETVDEIVAAARAMRARMIPGPFAPDAIDVCGTGGDGKHSLNVSTAVAIVVAACGIKVAKHGNRAASSISGAADVLAALGIPELPMDRLGACLDNIGITFLHAARHHPAMARVAPVRRAIGRQTIFNLLGPLANPAGVERQMIGVSHADRVGDMGFALERLGSRSALIVHGDGYDELTVTGESHCMRLNWDNSVNSFEFLTMTPEAAGVGRHDAAALKGGDPAYNATRLLALLEGEQGAYHDMVAFNAGAALAMASTTLISTAVGTRQAKSAIASGAAADILARWRDFR